jgi:hypothetical protein
MLAFLLGSFRLVWLFGKGHHAVVLENLALRQQIAIYKRTQKRPRLIRRDRWFLIALSLAWKDWRRALCVVHPDTVGNGTTISIDNALLTVWRNTNAIAVGPTGSFYPTWIDAYRGNQELRVAEVDVVSAESMVATATQGLKERSDQLAVLYGGKQSFDRKTRTLTLQVAIRNVGDRPLTGPFKLVVTHFTDTGCAHIANANNGAHFAGAVWDLSATLPMKALRPGETGHPYPLRFRVEGSKKSKCRDTDSVGLTVQVFAAQDSISPTQQ